MTIDSMPFAAQVIVQLKNSRPYFHKSDDGTWLTLFVAGVDDLPGPDLRRKGGGGQESGPKASH